MNVHILGKCYVGISGVAFFCGQFSERMPGIISKGIHEASLDEIREMFPERIIGQVSRKKSLKGRSMKQFLDRLLNEYLPLRKCP